MVRKFTATGIAFAVLATASPALAKKEPEPPVTLNKCATSYGTIAVIDGEVQGWTKYNLGSPRELIGALALESGCFAPAGADGKPANFLMNVSAGDKEEVDKTVNLATSAAKEGLARSGVLARTGFGGAALGGMLGGFGGKKKTVAAAIRLMNPANGQTLITGSGDVQKTTITLEGVGNPLGQSSQNSGYGSSKDGKMLIEAFIKAFNALSGQGTALQAMMPPPPPPVVPAAVPATPVKKR